MDVVAQGAVGAAGPAFLQPAVEDRQVRAALGDPLLQVGPVEVEFTGPVLPLAVQHRLRAGGADVLADGVAAQSEPAGDFAQTQTLLGLGPDRGVGVAEPVEDFPGG